MIRVTWPLPSLLYHDPPAQRSYIYRRKVSGRATQVRWWDEDRGQLPAVAIRADSIRCLRRYRVMVLAIAVAAMLAAVGYTLIQGKTYRASSNA